LTGRAFKGTCGDLGRRKEMTSTNGLRLLYQNRSQPLTLIYDCSGLWAWYWYGKFIITSVVGTISDLSDVIYQTQVSHIHQFFFLLPPQVTPGILNSSPRQVSRVENPNLVGLVSRPFA
jgi:hypothetical protein